MTTANEVAIQIVNQTLGVDLMARRINEKWKDEMHEAVNKYHTQGFIPERQIFTWNVSCKWYIRLLTETNTPFKLIQKGAGVKEVVIEYHKCPACKGKGYISKGDAYICPKCSRKGLPSIRGNMCTSCANKESHGE